MATMTPRERVRAAINHQEPDRVPTDLGGTNFSTILAPAYLNLMEHLMIPVEANLELRKISQAVRYPSPVLLDRLGVDTRGVWFPEAPDVSIDKDFPDGRWRDEWGAIRIKPESSHVYDLVQPPLPGDITVRDVENFAWPDPHDPGRMRGLREEARKLHEENRYGIVGGVAVNIVHFAQYIRGFEDWFVDFVLRPKVAHALYERLTDWVLEIAKDAIDEIGEYVDVWGFADDIAGQTGPMFAPKHYREFIKPQHARLYDLFKERTPEAGRMFHSCGSVDWAVDDLLEIGANILNPVQVSAANMDTKELKRRWGDQMTFWGAIDTQRVLPFGSPQDVRDEVQRRIEDLAPGGGFVLTSVHNIQPEVPPENIVAMFEAVAEATGES